MYVCMYVCVCVCVYVYVCVWVYGCDDVRKYFLERMRSKVYNACCVHGCKYVGAAGMSARGTHVTVTVPGVDRRVWTCVNWLCSSQVCGIMAAAPTKQRHNLSWPPYLN